MTHKQLVTTALRHEPPDKVPYHVGFTVPARQKMAEYYGDPQFPAGIGNHMTVVPVIRVEWGVRGDDGYYTDEFGLRWNRQVDADIGMPEGTLTRKTFDDFTWPDPQASGRFDQLARTIERQPDQFVVMALDFSLFERAWGLVGLENFLLAMAEDAPFVEAVLDRILAFNLALIDAGLSRCPNVDAVYFGDDFGSQQGVMMGTARWRRLLKPRLERQYARVRDHGKFVFIHSCGAVGGLFDDFIEIGVDCFNPFQPEVIDIDAAKRAYSGRLAFWGGISIQRLLPYGSPAQVRGEVGRILREIGASGGYIAAPSHDVPGDVPAENIAAMLEVLQAR
jgi:uroporphyrinogen decarboxylase